MVYTPAMTPGYSVTLSVRGARYVVHVGQGRAVVCQGPATSGARDAPVPGSEDTAAARTSPASAVAGLKLAEQARDELAKKLLVEKGQVTINFFRPATWPDASLGCPARGPGLSEAADEGLHHRARVRRKNLRVPLGHEPRRALRSIAAVVREGGL